MSFFKPLFYALVMQIMFCNVLFSQHKQDILTKKYPPIQLRQDATVLKDVVLAMHPVVGIYRSRAYYDSLFTSYINALNDSLTEKQFRISLKQLIDYLHCGHTEIGLSKASLKAITKTKQNYSPLVFLPLQNKVYFLATTQKKYDTLLKKGAEIIRINGVSCDSMLPQIRRIISGDGYNVSGKQHYASLAFNVFYPALFGRPDTFFVEAKTNDQIKKIKYPAFQAKSFPPLPLGAKDSLFVTYKKAGMKYKYLDKNNKTLLLKIEKFSHVKYRKAYRKIFKRLEKNKTENLVIDLRNNGGGSLANAYKLLTYLMDTVSTQSLKTRIRNYPYKKHTSGNIWFKFTRFAFSRMGQHVVKNDTDIYVYAIRPIKRHHFDGKVMVLIDGGSFSASALVSAYLKYKHRASFIGEETGGALEGCNAGVTPYYILPNTKVRLRVPAFRIEHDVSAKITGYGIIPEYQILYGIKDIFSKKDLALIKAKELLKIE